MGGRIIKKVALLGDIKVGKTSLFSRFLKNAFSEEYSETIGVNIGKKDVPVEESREGRVVTLLVWDIFGSHLHGDVRRLAMENVDAVILVSDISSEPSMKSVVDFWIPSISEMLDSSRIYFDLNKIDLIEDSQVEERVKAFGDMLKELFGESRKDSIFLTSAKNGSGVPDMFRTIAADMLSGNPVDEFRELRIKKSTPSEGQENPLFRLFDKIVSDIIPLFKDDSRGEEILHEAYKMSNLNTEDIIPEELGEFIDMIQEKLAESGISPSVVYRLTSNWKRSLAEVSSQSGR